MESLSKKILELKERENALVLAHNYQRPEVQDIADFVGDSLELSMESTKTDSDYIVFCGVDFMAEGAAMLNPGKTVLIPDRNAICPMASMLPVEKLREYKREYPCASVVLYINTRAEAKAEADVICTSANAVEVINSLENDTVLFGPDCNLAYYASKRSEKSIIPVPEGGHCYVHKHHLALPDIELVKDQHPDAVLFAHPECDPEVQEMADYVLSTGGMIKKAREVDAKEIIVGTEEGLVYRLAKDNPGKTFYKVDYAVCKNMKLHTLEKVYEALKEKKFVVRVDEKIAEMAQAALEKMLEISKKD